MTDAARRVALALAALFFALGFIGASWVSRIPAVQDELGLSNGRLGLALLGVPLGSVLGSAVMPRLLAHGHRRATALVTVAAAASLAAPGAAGGEGTLALALGGFGLATGALDVSLNTLAVGVQSTVGRSVFTRLHAMWSLGAFVGAGVGVAVATAGVTPEVHLAVAAVVVAVAALPVTAALGSPAGAGADPASSRVGWTRDRRVATFAVVALAALVLEVAAADWGGVFVRHVLHQGGGAAAGAFAVFSGPHFLARLAGDRVADRVARPTLLCVGLLLGAAGLVLLAASPTVAVGYAGLAVTGVGVSAVFPLAVAGAGSVDGHPAGTGVATAAGLSYVGWSVTPAIIGGLASVSGLRIALLLPVVVALAAAAVVRRGPGPREAV